MINTLDKISLDKFVAFNNVVRHGSVAKAAEKLNVPTFKVHNDLKSLEKSVGTPLILRNQKKVVLTPIGRKIADFSRFMVDEITCLNNAITGVNAIEDVVIACRPGFAEVYIPEIIEKLSKKFPNIYISLKIGQEYLDFTGQDCDIVMGNQLTNRADLTQQFLTTFHHALYSSKSYWKHQSCPDNLNQLKGHRLLTHEATVALFPEFCKKLYKNNRIIVQSTFYTPLVALMERGVGISLVCIESLSKIARDGKNLICLFNDLPPEKEDFFFLTRKFSPKASLLEEIFQITKEVLNKETS